MQNKDILQYIKSRRSIREFTDEPVDDNQITKILDAARWAPSAGNCQPWRFIVVRDKKKQKEFDPLFHQSCIEKAPVIIVVLADPEDTRKRYGRHCPWYIQDCAAATENMLLTVHGLGLGAVWVGAFNHNAVKEQLEIMDSEYKIEPQYMIMALVCLGHYQEDSKINNSKRQRKELDEIAFCDNLKTPWTHKE